MNWTEINRKEEFQRILNLLIEFEERTGRHKKYGDPKIHDQRKKIAHAKPEKIRIFAKHRGGFMFHIVIEYEEFSAELILDDGIMEERDEFRHNPDHVVHTIVCTTDLVKSGTEIINFDSLYCETYNLMIGEEDEYSNVKAI